MSDKPADIDRDRVSSVLDWYAKGFGHRSVVAAGILASSSLWVSDPITRVEQSSLAFCFFTILLFLIAHDSITKYADIALAADDKVVKSTFDPDGKNAKKWKNLMLLSRFQFAFVAFAGCAAAASVIMK